MAMAERREIKFRVWNEPRRTPWGHLDGCMEAIDLSWFEEQGIATCSDLPVERHLMQFTGVQDSNGREIYEGDIVIVTGLSGRGTGVVTWGAAGFRILATFRTSDGCFSHQQDGTFTELRPCEVLGNIYEHPDLVPALPEHAVPRELVVPSRVLPLTDSYAVPHSIAAMTRHQPIWKNSSAR